ncbi:MAG TPA: 50S ribosomal protein L24e [Methanolinea sp.]|nr:50S ribosomal protein L24e [Methanolinea sp.]HQK55861.1 50S ribosomal protein L24e [Methanolinea sp.]
MVEQRTCSFCGDAIEPGTGKMFVRKDGTVYYFCSTKCQNNHRLGRASRRVPWTQAGRKAMGKE